jgi:hypothetical protein
MTIKRWMLAVIVSLAAVPIARPAAAPPQADASCATDLAQLQRQTQAFGRDVAAQNLEFLKNDVKDAAITGIRNRLAGDPTVDALEDLNKKVGELSSWEEDIKRSVSSIQDVSACWALTTGFTNCMIEASKRWNDAFARWVNSLGDAGLTQAAERVTKAASLIEDYHRRAFTMAMGAALNNCTDRFEQRVRAAEGNAVSPSPAPRPRAGSGMGKKIGIPAAIGGGALAALLAVDQMSKGGDDFIVDPIVGPVVDPVVNPVNPPPANNSIQVTILSPLNCTLASAGTFYNCTGLRASVTFPQSFSNQNIVAVMVPRGIPATTETVSGTGTTQIFTWTNKSTTTPCPGNQAGIFFYRDAGLSGPVIGSWSGTIQVTCAD